MRTKAKSRLTILLILLSFAVISIVSITAIFALTQQNTKTRVDITYTALDLEDMVFELNDDNTYSLSGVSDDFEGGLFIPSTYNGVTITEISNNAFINNKKITSINFSSSNITNIGHGAFAGCTNIKTIKFNSKLEKSGDDTFYGCTSLENVYISDINAWAEIEFYNYYGNPLYYAKNLYVNGTLITDLVLDNTVTKIGSCAFSNCLWLTSVTIGSGVTSIGNYAFYNTKFTEIAIPGNVNTIGSSAFESCDLTSVTINSGVTSIGWSAFEGCTGLKSITIPNSVTSIGNSVFSGCTELTEINAAEGNSVYYSYENCIIERESKRLILGCKSSKIPADGSVTTIGEYAFSGCTGLTSIVIPENVIKLELFAFVGCEGLVSVTIGADVNNIERIAFSGCTSLTTVIFVNTEGWFVATKSTATSGTNLTSDNLANPSTAATYLTSTYFQYYWTRV